MNILFIHSEKNSIEAAKPVYQQMSVQLGISYIASLLKSNGHTTDLFILSRNKKLKNLDNSITAFKPELICFTAVFSEFNLICKIAEYIKSTYPEIYLLAGGPHITLNPETAIGGTFDAICLAEGEWPTLELVRQLEEKKKPGGIQNLWIKKDGLIEKNATRPFLQELDTLPFPERQMWQPWVRSPKSAHTILLGRGCPFQCTYCSNHALRKVCPGTYVRYRSPENIVKEVDQLQRDFPSPSQIYLEIETIGVNLKFAHSLFKELADYNRKLKQPLEFGINLRITPNANYSEMFSLMKEANFSFVNIGLESGSEQTRKDILRRNYSNEDFYQAIEAAKKNDIKAKVYLMIGLPGENRKEFQKKVQCLKKAQPDWLISSIFFPYPGTDIYKYCQQHNLLPSKMDTKAERSRASLNLPGFSKRQIQTEYYLLNYKIYKSTKSLGVILKDTKNVVMRSSITLQYIRKLTSKISWGWRFIKANIRKHIFRQ